MSRESDHGTSKEKANIYINEGYFFPSGLT